MGSVSGSWGMPVEEENRAITGVVGLLKCGALERDEATAVGLKWPERRIPLAWTDWGGVSATTVCAVVGYGGLLTGAEAGVRPENLVQDVHDAVGGLDGLGVCGERHAGQGAGEC